MRKTRLAIVLTVVIGLFCCCDRTGSQENSLPSSTGKSGEVLIVCEDNYWENLLGDSLQAILMQPVLGLPQKEPMFILSHISENKFEKTYKKQRNIIFFTIDSAIEEPKVFVNQDPWTQPQLLIRIQAKDEQQTVEILSEYQHAIIEYLLHSEHKRFQKVQRAEQNIYLISEVEKKYGISMVIPEGFIFAVKDSGFCWLRKDTKDWTQNILIYIQDYTDTNQLKNEEIIKLRNTFTKQYVFGSVDSSYAVVDEQYIPTISKYKALNGQYAIQTVGLWKMEKDCKGGAFSNMTILDTAHNRVVTIDGFLYAPSNEKRDLLRQLEAIVFSVKFKNKNSK